MFAHSSGAFNTMQNLATSVTLAQPMPTEPGWWATPKLQAAPTTRRIGAGSRLLILGARGMLGTAFVKHCVKRNLPHLALTHAEVDICEPMAVRRAVAACRPWAVINATGYTDIDAAEVDRAECMRVNATGATNIAEACERMKIRFLTFSSDLVFDGNQCTPYEEGDRLNPLNVCGESKQRAEEAVQSVLASTLVVRTSALFGPWDENNFVTRVLRLLTRGRSVYAPHHVVSPTYAPALVERALNLLMDRQEGLWHLTSQHPVSWYDFARLVAETAGFSSALVHECQPSSIGWIAPRPAYAALASTRGALLPKLDESLDRLFEARSSLLS